MSFDLLAEAQNDGFRVTRKSTSRHGQYNGPCILPTCSGAGHDRLRIQPNIGEYGWFACSVCGQKGNGVDWLMLMRGMSMNEALKAVGWKPKDGSTPRFAIPESVITTHSTHKAPPEDWQTTGKAFVQWCKDTLWSERGQDALDYLHSRGFTDDTIKAAELGYNPTRRGMNNNWGVGPWHFLAEGIVIPWFIGGELWRITIRDESVQKGESGRYKQVKGGSNGLYFADTLIYNRPVILVEGEFDALSILQVCGHDVSVCATGSTEGSHITRWVTALAEKDVVLIAFDAEKDKGDKCANWWLERIETAQRLRPLWADANQMLQEGIDLWKEWIQPALLARVEATPQPETRETSTKQEELTDIVPTLPSTCILCSSEAERYISAELAYCQRHYDELTCQHDTLPQDDLLDHPVVKAVRNLFDATVLEVVPTADWPRRKEELLAEARERVRQERRAEALSSPWIHDPSRPVIPEEVWRAIPRGEIWQKMIAGEDFGPEDYWEQLHAKLERRGYFERFARDEAALLEKIRIVSGKVLL